MKYIGLNQSRIKVL